MSGYTIEFDKRDNEKVDVPQIASTANVTVDALGFDSTSELFTIYPSSDIWSAFPDSYYGNVRGSDDPKDELSLSGNNLISTSVAYSIASRSFRNILFNVASLRGKTVKLSYSCSGSGYVEPPKVYQYWNGSGNSSTFATGTSQTDLVCNIRSDADAFILLAIQDNGLGETTTVTKFQVIDGTSVTTIIDSTDTQGQPHAGGLDVAVTENEIQSGAPLATLPSSEFGLEVKHDGQTLAELKHLSPSQGTEATELTATSTTIFTPTTSDLTVEAIGCNESQVVEQELTNVVVEEL